MPHPDAHRTQLTADIKAKGLELGFDLVGVAKATLLEQEARDLEQWLRAGHQGEMAWMENHFDKRVDPRKLVDGAESVISVLHNYYPAVAQPEGAPRISRYVFGEDYHTVLKRKLYTLFRYIHERVGEAVPGRVFVDSAPVMDKAWARRSGLGWIGKHTNLISPQRGSWFFIGEIILALPLDYDPGPIRDFCGTCTRCIDACPTGALQPYQIDARKCISYLTIELRDDIPARYHDQMEGWAYGCDICQEVCPWNRFSLPEGDAFQPLPHVAFSAEQWEELDERTFKRLRRRTAMNRVRWEKIKGNLQLWQANRNPEP
ncbi:MAG: tRNA epoxyqueuosine(34) reductase QueG [Bacteroidetes bacterium]|nr:MAG: tRNA epoxyqueuosine(34) reductase QueG [Bacteroidota bacterium]